MNDGTNSLWLASMVVLAVGSAGCEPTFECDHYTYGEVGLRDVEYTV